jgi:manganese efflux pump family protein
LLLTALAVAMDAVAVSIVSGMARGRASWGESFRMGTVFGLFQAAMPAIGYALGNAFRGAIEAYDHWVAFLLLAAVGLHMIWESFEEGALRPQVPDPFSARRLLVLGFATSVDALAVGLTLALIEVPFALAVGVIGLATFALCVPAVHMGARLGIRFAHRAEALGGIVLIGLGARILWEHLL